MPNSSSSPELFPSLPQAQDDPAAWGHWATDFLDRLCQVWNGWRRTWTQREVPCYQEGYSDAFFILERETRVVGTTHEWVTGPPPTGFSGAAPLLDACSGAVQRFSATSAWAFETAKQADEIAEEMLVMVQYIRAERFTHIRAAQLERIYRLVRMAIHRGKSTVQKTTPPATKRGRKPDTDPDEDRRIADAWAGGHFKTFADLDREFDLSAGTAKWSVDRHRHRKRK